MADPFSRSFRGPIKRLAHSVRSEMCNVRKKGTRGEGGRKGRRGWDSKKAYNLLTEPDWAGPPILWKELLRRQFMSGITPMTKIRERAWLHKPWTGSAFYSILLNLNPVYESIYQIWVLQHLKHYSTVWRVQGFYFTSALRHSLTLSWLICPFAVSVFAGDKVRTTQSKWY